MLSYTPYPLGHAQSPPTLVHTSRHQCAMRSPSFAILTSMRVSNEHRIYTHPASAVSKSRTSLRTLTYKARYSMPFWLRPPRLVICLGKGPCLGSPKLGRKGRSIPMTCREAGNRRKRYYLHTHLATPSLHPPWYTLQATSGLCTH